MTQRADLSKYLRSGQKLLSAQPTAPATQAAQDKKPYTPYRLSKEPKRHLELRLPFPDSSECPMNANLTNIRGEWRWGTGATLVYGKQMVVDIQGENLHELLEALKDWKVDWIAAFDPQEHAPPTDENAPFVRTIEITTERPEDPPPLQQRH